MAGGRRLFAAEKPTITQESEAMSPKIAFHCRRDGISRSHARKTAQLLAMHSAREASILFHDYFIAQAEMKSKRRRHRARGWRREVFRRRSKPALTFEPSPAVVRRDVNR